MGGSTPLVPKGWQCIRSANYRKAGFCPTSGRAFQPELPKDGRGLSCEVIGLSGQEMSDRPSVMLLENFFPLSCPLSTL